MRLLAFLGKCAAFPSRVVPLVLLGCVFLIFVWKCSLQAQTTLLTETDFIQLIKTNSPRFRAASLRPAVASANLMAARGAFDPKFGADFTQKTFDGKNYYALLDGGLKMQTWYGPELKIGYESAQGINVNPETSVPQNGLIYAGASVPVWRGLLFDDNRAGIRLAQIQQRSADIEQLALQNELYLEAGYRYWEWFAAFNKGNIAQEGNVLAEVLLDATRNAYLLGDKPAVDTLEASINLRSRQQSLLANRMEAQSLSLLLTTFAPESDVLAALFNRFRPSDLAEVVVLSEDLPQENLADQNPDLRLTRLKLEALEVERRAKQEYLKPQIDLNFNPLFAPAYDGTYSALSENFKWGVRASSSLLRRKERAGVQLADLKIQEMQLVLAQKTADVQAKDAAYRLQLQQLSEQIGVFRRLTNQYRALVEAEQTKFENGESSLFLVTYRQSAFLDANLKLVDLFAKYHQARLGLRFLYGLGG